MDKNKIITEYLLKKIIPFVESIDKIFSVVNYIINDSWRNDKDIDLFEKNNISWEKILNFILYNTEYNLIIKICLIISNIIYYYD